MPSATGLMRLSLVVAAVFAVGIVALVAASALIPTATVRNAVIAEIRAVTGLEPTIRGEVDGLAVSDRDGELLRRDAGTRRARDARR